LLFKQELKLFYITFYSYIPLVIFPILYFYQPSSIPLSSYHRPFVVLEVEDPELVSGDLGGKMQMLFFIAMLSTLPVS